VRIVGARISGGGDAQRDTIILSRDDYFMYLLINVFTYGSISDSFESRSIARYFASAGMALRTLIGKDHIPNREIQIFPTTANSN